MGTPLTTAITDSGFRKVWIAAQLEVSPSLLSRWMSGERTPSPENQKRLALLLRQNVTDLFPPADAACTDDDPSGVAA